MQLEIFLYKFTETNFDIMKHAFLILIALLFVASSCKKKQVKKIEKYVVEGNWKVTYFLHDGVNETSDYNQDSYHFMSDGTVHIYPPLIQVVFTGSWSCAKETDSSDDDLSDDNHVEFNLLLPNPYDELSDDWEIESYSDTKIELKDKSSDGSVDYLTIEKI
jgi:hypothetical protein